MSKGGGGLPFAVIAVGEDGDEDGFEDLERTPNTFTDAIERAQVGDLQHLALHMARTVLSSLECSQFSFYT